MAGPIPLTLEEKMERIKDKVKETMKFPPNLDTDDIDQQIALYTLELFSKSQSYCKQSIASVAHIITKKMETWVKNMLSDDCNLCHVDHRALKVINASIRKAVSDLTPREQTVIEMHICFNLSFTDIAKTFGCSIENARRIYAKTLRKLRMPNNVMRLHTAFSYFIREDIDIYDLIMNDAIRDIAGRRIKNVLDQTPVVEEEPVDNSTEDNINLLAGWIRQYVTDTNSKLTDIRANTKCFYKNVVCAMKYVGIDPNDTLLPVNYYAAANVTKSGKFVAKEIASKFSNSCTVEPLIDYINGEFSRRARICDEFIKYCNEYIASIEDKINAIEYEADSAYVRYVQICQRTPIRTFVETVIQHNYMKGISRSFPIYGKYHYQLDRTNHEYRDMIEMEFSQVCWAYSILEFRSVKTGWIQDLDTIAEMWRHFYYRIRLKPGHGFRSVIMKTHYNDPDGLLKDIMVHKDFCIMLKLKELHGELEKGLCEEYESELDALLDTPFNDNDDIVAFVKSHIQKIKELDLKYRDKAEACKKEPLVKFQQYVPRYHIRDMASAVNGIFRSACCRHDTSGKLGLYQKLRYCRETYHAIIAYFKIANAVSQYVNMIAYEVNGQILKFSKERHGEQFVVESFEYLYDALSKDDKFICDVLIIWNTAKTDQFVSDVGRYVEDVCNN